MSELAQAIEVVGVIWAITWGTVSVFRVLYGRCDRCD